MKPATSTNSRHAPNSSVEMSLVRPKVVTACITVASAVLRLTRNVSRVDLEIVRSFMLTGVRQGEESVQEGTRRAMANRMAA